MENLKHTPDKSTRASSSPESATRSAEQASKGETGLGEV
jgi:hypothetical protein